MAGIGGLEPVQAAESILPDFSTHVDGDKKLEFLAYRYVGFAFREAVALADIDMAAVLDWRVEDPEFVQVESKSSGPERAAIRREILTLMHTRNQMLVYKRDEQALTRVLGMDEGEFASKSDIEWALAARKNYTPGELAAIENLKSGNGSNGGSGNLVQVIQALARTSPDGTREIAVESRTSHATD